MARVSRLAGAIVAETAGAFYLVGNTKRPCDWQAVGFEPPGELDACKTPFVRLAPVRAVELEAPWLTLEVEGEALPRLIAALFVIERNGSISDRLWRLTIGADEAGDVVSDVVTGPAIDARWLGEMPLPIWQVVRNTVLRCT